MGCSLSTFPSSKEKWSLKCLMGPKMYHLMFIPSREKNASFEDHFALQKTRGQYILGKASICEVNVRFMVQEIWSSTGSPLTQAGQIER